MYKSVEGVKNVKIKQSIYYYCIFFFIIEWMAIRYSIMIKYWKKYQVKPLKKRKKNKFNSVKKIIDVLPKRMW